jgi:aryl-alcohol dehydrogenase-like predicted oxidoreductase
MKRNFLQRKGMSMQYRHLGESDMELSILGLGTWAMGSGGWAFAWGDQDEAASIRAIHHALELDINWIDTAAIYGLGLAEEVVGRALKQASRKPFLFTKCAMRWDEKGRISYSLKRDSVRQECEASLRRLQVDVIDLYQIHWPNPAEDIEEGWSAMAELQREGKVRYIGVSNFNVAQLERAAAIAPITSLQPPYSALDQDVATEILPWCQAHNVGVIAYSPMGSGLLTGAMTAERVAQMPKDDWRRRDNDFKEPRLARNLALAQLMGEIGQPHAVSTAAVALGWVLANGAVTGAIVGARSPEQVDGFIAGGDFRLAPEEYARINQFIAEHP